MTPDVLYIGLSRNASGTTVDLGRRPGQIVIRQGCDISDEPIEWTPTNRRQHNRGELRYGSDLTDAEWAILEPLLPAPAPTGRKRAWPMQEVVNAMFYILRGGVAWRLLPSHFPGLGMAA